MMVAFLTIFSSAGLGVFLIFKSPPSDVILPLDVTFDRHLTFLKHIGLLCRQSFFQLHSFCRIRRYLDEDATNTLVHALVLSRLDY